MGKGFDLGAFAASLAPVSERDTAPESIRLIDIDLLQADEKNFFSMTDSSIEKLASNIELLGQMDPCRVRELPDGKYRIVSGHRRTAARRLLVSEGKNFRQVPCIVECGNDSEEMQQLRLIFANSDTRELTPADLMETARQVEELLYKLKEQGVEFPGKMRDQVAAACHTHSTALAELKVIREKLLPEWKELFSAGTINKSVAYQLARLDPDVQEKAFELKGKRIPIAEGVKTLSHNLPRMKAQDGAICRHKGTEQCGNYEGFVKANIRAATDWKTCAGKCCENCYEKACCPGACKTTKALAQAEAAKRKKDNESRAERDKQRRQELAAKSVQNAGRLLAAIEQAGFTGTLPCDYYGREVPVKEIRSAAAGKVEDSYYSENFIPSNPERLIECAKRLNCSADYLLGLTDQLRPKEPEPGQLMIMGWMPGGTIPGHPCECVAQVDFDDGGQPVKHLAEWDGSEWIFRGMPFNVKIVKWCELPAEG